MRHLLASLLLLVGCPTPDDSPGDDDDATTDDDDATGDDDDASDDDDATGDDDDATGDDDDATGDDDDATGDDDDASPTGAFLYAHTATDLYTIDPTPPYDETWLGSFGATTPDVTDIGIDATGAIWGVGFYETFTIDPASAAATLLGTNQWGLNAMTVQADGTLLAGGMGNLFSVDPTTGALSFRLSLAPWVFAGDMVGLPDGLLYCLVAQSTDPTGPTSLMTVDLASGATTVVGPTGAGSMFGMAYHAQSDTIFGFADSGAIYTIDRTSGAAVVARTSSNAWWGATTNPARWGS